MKKLRISYNAPITLTFVSICFIATILGVITRDAVTRVLFLTYRDSLTNPMTYVRFFTHIFGHSGWSHFIGNASYLLLLGPLLEEKYGAKGILMVMAITSVVTALVNFLIFPNMGLCGASGVVFAFILLASFTGFKEGELPLTFILVAAIFLGQQIVEGVTLRDDISNMAHIAGGIIGAAFGYFFNKGKEPVKEDDSEQKSL